MAASDSVFDDSFGPHGKSGPEGIEPLKRGADGNLGLRHETRIGDLTIEEFTALIREALMPKPHPLRW